MSVEPSHFVAEIENLMAEDRLFPPDPAFAAQANATADLYAEAEADFEAFWAKRARERVDWSTPFETTLEWDLPFAKWFTGGELNVAYNCVDRHVENGLGDKVAYHWIGEPGDTRTLTFRDLQREVSKAANALKELGVGKGDRVAIYMPMIPELPIAMLACARLGAPHTVVFGGFSAEALSGRINDCGAKVLITADGGYRRGKAVGLKAACRRGARRHARRSSRPSSSSGPTRTSRWSPGATTGGTTSSIASPRTARRCRSTPSTCSTCSTRRARPPSPRASCTRPPATSLGHVVQPPGGLRHQARRRVLVRCRHRLGDRPQLHRVRPAGQRDDRGHVRGRAGHAGLGPLVADHRGLQGLDPVLRADGHPRVHEAGRGAAGRPRPVDPAASSGRSASRSIPKPGCGTGSTSAATGRRSSTPGGRPRPARS